MNIEFLKFKHSKHRYITLLINNVFLLIFFLFVYECKYDSSDDKIMELIASGYFGSPDSHLIFINSIIGYFLKTLYIWFPKVNWYIIFLYFVSLISITTIYYVLIKSHNNIKILCFLIFVFTWFFIFQEIEFTKVSFVSTCSGYLLLDFSVKNNRKLCLPVVLLLIVGSMIRLDMFLVTSLICVILFIPYFIDAINNDRKAKVIIKRILITGLICFIVLCVTLSIDALNYRDSSWQKYKEFNGIRSNLVDGGFPNYEININKYNEIGFNKISYDFLKKLDFDDPYIFNLKTMNDIQDIKNKTIKPSYTKTFISFIGYMVDYFTKDKIVIYSILSIIIIILYIMFSNKKYIVPCIFVVLTLSYFYSYCVRNFKFTNWVSISLLLCALIVLLYCFDSKELNDSNSYYIICIFIICAFLFCLTFNKTKLYAKLEDDNFKLYEVISNDKDCLYLYESLNLIVDNRNIHFTSFSSIGNNNVLPLGDWLTYSPLMNNKKKEYGIVNPYFDCIDNKKIKYIVRDIAPILDYIHINYGINVEAMYLGKIGDYNIYNVVSTKQ